LRERTPHFILSITAFLVFILSSGSLFAIDTSEPVAAPPLPEVRAMGRAYTAVANDENTVFYNPAGYATIEEGIVSVLSLDLKINVDESAVNLMDAIISGKDITSTSNILSYLRNTTFAPGIAGPLYFGRVGNNFGFAFYDNLYMRFSTRSGAILPIAEFYAYTDLGFIGGYGAPLPFLDNLYGGINFKVLLRMKSRIKGSVVDVIDTLGELGDLPAAKSVGFGADLGLLYMPLPWLSLGLTGQDFFGTRFHWQVIGGSRSFPKSMIKPRIAFGSAVYPLKLFSTRERSSDLVVALDYYDLLDYSSVLSNIKLGARFSTLRIIDLMGGIDGGYLTGGLGFNLKIVHIGVYYYVDELGFYPGAKPVQNFTFNFALKW